MTVYSVPVNITRADLLQHCDTCKCRSARQLIAVDFVEVFATNSDLEKIKRAALSSAEVKWYDERKKDWDRYELTAGEPTLIRDGVVTA